MCYCTFFYYVFKLRRIEGPAGFSTQAVQVIISQTDDALIYGKPVHFQQLFPDQLWLKLKGIERIFERKDFLNYLDGFFYFFGFGFV